MCGIKVSLPWVSLWDLSPAVAGAGRGFWGGVALSLCAVGLFLGEHCNAAGDRSGAPLVSPSGRAPQGRDAGRECLL